MAMIEMDANYWSRNLQPVIQKEWMSAKPRLKSMDEYLGAVGHEFSDYRKPNYVFRLFFDNTENEIAFRLRYEIK